MTGESQRLKRSTRNRHQRKKNQCPNEENNDATSDPDDPNTGTGAGETTSGEITGVRVRVRPHPQFEGIYQVALDDGSHRLATRNLSPGRSVYGERLVQFKGVEYRVWDAFRSKLAAAILKGVQNVPIKPGHRVL